jgi:hypothetical protein
MQPDRLSHIYLIGKTGVGKSTLLEVLARQDLGAGRGFALIDPHGDLAERLRFAAEPKLGDRLVYLDAADLTQPFGFNPLRRVRDDKIPLAASGLLDTLRKLWPDAWGVRIADSDDAAMSFRDHAASHSGTIPPRVGGAFSTF